MMQGGGLGVQLARSVLSWTALELDMGSCSAGESAVPVCLKEYATQGRNMSQPARELHIAP